MTSSTLQQQIAAALESCPYTLEEVAARADINPRTLYNLRKGHPVRSSSLEAVAAVLGLRLLAVHIHSPQETTP